MWRSPFSGECVHTAMLGNHVSTGPEKAGPKVVKRTRASSSNILGKPSAIKTKRGIPRSGRTRPESKSDLFWAPGFPKVRKIREEMTEKMEESLDECRFGLNPWDCELSGIGPAWAHMKGLDL